MADKTETKITRTYSLDPVVIAWVTQKAARLTMQGDGDRASDSKVVNDILTAAMEQDTRLEKLKGRVTQRVKAVAE